MQSLQLAALFFVTLHAPLPAPIRIVDVTSTVGANSVEARVTSAAPLYDTGAYGTIKDNALRIFFSGKLAEDEHYFGVGLRRIRVRMEARNQFEIKVPFPYTMTCKEPVELSWSQMGLIARAKCGPLRGGIVIDPEDNETMAKPAETKATTAISATAAKTITAATGATKNAPEAITDTGKSPAGLTISASKNESASSDTTSKPSGSTSGTSSTSYFLPGVFFLLLGGAAVYLARRKKQQSNLVEIVETANLGPKRTLVVARVSGETLLLGSSEAGISLLSTRPEADDAATTSNSAAAAANTAPSTNVALVSAPSTSFLAHLEFAQRNGSSSSNDEGSFDSFLSDSPQDEEELRRKLAAGIAARVQ